MILSEGLAGWLRRTGVEVAASRLAGPRWLVQADLAPLYGSVGALERAGDEIDAVRSDLRRQLTQTAESLGWSGAAGEAASGRAGRAGAQLAELAELLRELSQQLSRHARYVEDAREELRVVVDEAEHLLRQSGDGELAATLAVLRESGDESLDRLTALHRCAARMREVLTEADRQDQSRAARVVDLGSAILDLAATSESDSWVGDTVVPEARRVLESVGIVQPAAERAMVEWASELPPDADGARQLRVRLDGMSSESLADLLLRRPGLAAVLVHADPSDAPPLASLDAESRRRVALLHPSVVGNLADAPVADRVAANRVAVAAALFEAKVAGDEHDMRAAWYERLLYERVPDPHAGPRRPALTHHQVVAFDARTGHVAEIWGHIEPGRTREVVLLSPDDPTDLASLTEVSDKARATAARDPGVVVVAWTGSGPPDLGSSLPAEVQVRSFEDSD